MADNFTDEEDGEEADREFSAIGAIEVQLRQSPLSAARLGAVALVTLYHSNAFRDETPLTPNDIVAGDCQDEAWWAITSLITIRSGLCGATRRCADELLDNPAIALWDSVLHRRDAPQLLEAAE